MSAGNCPQCSAPLAADARFCGRCGYAVGESVRPHAGGTIQGAAAPVAARKPAKTMLGVAMGADIPANVPDGTIRGAPSPVRPRAQTMMAGGTHVAPSTNVPDATMLGMPKANVAEVAAAAAPAPQRKVTMQLDASNRTMLGTQPLEPPPGPPVDVWAAAEPRAGSSYGDVPPSNDGTKSGRSKAALIVLAFAVGALVFGAIAWFVKSSRHSLEVRVAQGESGDALVVRAGEAKPGTRLRFRGVERPVENAEATFALDASSLSLGENELNVDVIAPSGETTHESLVVFVDYRVFAELSGLDASPPTFSIVVLAAEGLTVEVDGRSVPLTGGRGAVTVSVDTSHARGNIARHEARYRVRLADGSSVDGTVAVSVPVATLRIDRPGMTLVTDESSVEIAGASDAQATVTLDGESVAVEAGRFLRRVSLASLGERTFVVAASSAGKARQERRIVVRRVADLAAEARGFAVDAALTYARIQPNPNVYRGQGIRLEGRVYNVDQSEGTTTLQALARDCPRGQRCPVWIHYGAATDVQINDWVEVVGRVDGEQQFRTDSNELRSVPRIDAAFVIRRGE